MHKRNLTLIFSILLLFLLAACQQDDQAPPTLMPTADVAAVESESEPVAEAETAVPEDAEEDEVPEATVTPVPPTATPQPAKSLTICMAQEPDTLFWYGDGTLPGTAVHHALYENLYTTLDYAHQAQGLSKLPSLEDGDAVIEAVPVQVGDQIVNAAGNVVPLLSGTQVVNADGEFVTYDPPGEGEPPLMMQQMVVDFTFQPLVWSDGTAVSADDSVFAFEVARELAPLAEQREVERTQSYEVTGDLSVRWASLPGYLSPRYFINAWTPLPSHLYAGMSSEEMLASPAMTEKPLSHGPYMVAEWTQGESLVLQANPHYYRADEGLPNIDEVTIRFDVDVSDAVQAITSGDCDVVTEDGIGLAQLPALVDGEAAGEIRPYFTPNLIFEHIDFGVNSWDNYGDGNPGGRPDWFDFITVRQAITQCVDRQSMVDEFFAGQSQIMNSYIPGDHPLYPEDALDWPYDPDAGNAALDDFGLEDTDGDGLREFVERDLQNTIVATTTFSITLGTDSESAVRLRINEMVQEDLAACGIAVNLYDVPAERWYDDGPFSALFGRRFDLGTYAWLTGITPPCSLYLSTNITGPEERGFGGWGNINATGWASEEYDLACQSALNALPDTAEYSENHSQAVRIFNERVPAIPLFQYVKTAVSAPTVSNISPNSSQPSELWNIFEWDIESNE